MKVTAGELKAAEVQFARWYGHKWIATHYDICPNFGKPGYQNCQCCQCQGCHGRCVKWQNDTTAKMAEEIAHATRYQGKPADEIAGMWIEQMARATKYESDARQQAEIAERCRRDKDAAEEKVEQLEKYGRTNQHIAETNRELYEQASQRIKELETERHDVFVPLANAVRNVLPPANTLYDQVALAHRIIAELEDENKKFKEILHSCRSSLGYSLGDLPIDLPAEVGRVRKQCTEQAKRIAELEAAIFGPQDGTTAHEFVDAVTVVSELRQFNARHLQRIAEMEADIVQGAGELLVPVPAPGTDMAKAIRAVAVLKSRVRELEAENAGICKWVNENCKLTGASPELTAIQKVIAHVATLEDSRAVAVNAARMNLSDLMQTRVDLTLAQEQKAAAVKQRTVECAAIVGSLMHRYSNAYLINGEVAQKLILELNNPPSSSYPFGLDRSGKQCQCWKSPTGIYQRTAENGETEYLRTWDQFCRVCGAKRVKVA